MTGYRVLAPDLRGHGTAGAARPVDLELTAADMVARAPEAFTLCGYPMGGRIALHVASLDPDRVERERRRAADEALAAEIDALTGDDAAYEAWLDRWEAQPLFAATPAKARRAPARTGCATRLRGLRRRSGASDGIDVTAVTAAPTPAHAGGRDRG